MNTASSLFTSENTIRMLAHLLSNFCEANVVLRKHFISIIAAEEVKRLKKSVVANCFWIANTDNFPGKHWYLIVRTLDNEWQVFDPLGTCLEY